MTIIDKIFSCKELIENPPILLDIGASGEIHPKWKTIAKYSICIAFDADDREIGYAVNESKGYRKLYLFNSLVTDKMTTDADFFLTKSPYCSSLLEPDLPNIQNWNFGDLFEVEKIVRLKTVFLPKALQDIGITKIDWFKTDSQGIDLRLFTSLGENITKKILVAEFEPGILDGYKKEDKLCTLMSYMDKKPFWLSDAKICGTQRISKSALIKKFSDYSNQLHPHMLQKTSPGWCEVEYFNNFALDASYLDQRDYLLGWVFAIIEQQYGFALDVALRGYERFNEVIFDELANCSVDIITRKSDPDEVLKRYGQSPTPVYSSIIGLKEKAVKYINEGHDRDAFTVLSQIKSKRIPLEGIDYLRAICFLRMDDPGNARVALREELCYFPENSQAKNLLNQLQTENKVTSAVIEDLEFLRVYELIAPYTMLNQVRLYSLFNLAKHICISDIPGNFVECGVAAGGSSALLGYVIKTYSKQPRYLYAFDSYEGLPAPRDIDTCNGVEAEVMGWGAGTCSAPEESVKEICMRLRVLHLVKPVKGFYEDSLPKFKSYIGPLAFLHADADWYDSITTVFTNLYGLLSDGAIVQLDDYGYWEGCKKAFDDFVASQKIAINLQDIDSCAVWFQKSMSSAPDFDELSNIRCPLTGSANIKLIRSFDADLLEAGYKSDFGIDVGNYLAGTKEIKIYQSLDTGYSFYYPFNIAGDSHFYEELQKLPWYYMDWKWEHDIAWEQLKSSDLVLEIGCGNGSFLQKIQQNEIKCFGLEMNREALEQAKGKGLDVAGESIQSHALSNSNKYDVVCLFQVIEHVPDVGEFLAACLETLKSGGKLIISVPNNDSLMFKLPDLLTINAPPHHMGLWGINSLLSLTRVFPLRLDELVQEPLQAYHVEFSKELIRQKLTEKQLCTEAELSDCNTISSNVMELMLNNIPGHTVMAIYTKI